MPIKVELKGFQKVNENLKQFAAKDAIKIVRSGVGAGATVVRKKARQKAPRKSGLLRKAIRSKSNKVRGPIVSSSVFVDPTKAPHWHLIEFGHRIVQRGPEGDSNRGGQSIGSVAPRPFLRPALFGSKGKILKAMAAKMSERISKFRAS